MGNLIKLDSVMDAVTGFQMDSYDSYSQVVGELSKPDQFMYKVSQTQFMYKLSQTSSCIS